MFYTLLELTLTSGSPAQNRIGSGTDSADVRTTVSAAAVAVAEKAYSSMTVELAHDYNANTAYFDGIQLFKEQFANSYTYDANGNVTSVVDR